MTSAVRRGARLLAVSLLLLGVGACSRFLNDDEGLIRNRDDDYRDARTVPPPEVPADLDGSGIRDSMFVPEVSGMDAYLAQEDFELPRPATLFAPEEERQVRIQRFGEDEWVVAPDPPSVVWPRVKQFLSDNGVAIVRETPETGVLETEWITIEARPYRDVVRATLAQGSPEPVQGLRLRVEQAVRRGATEVHLLQAGVERRPEDFSWPPRSTRPAIATSLLRELAGYLAADVGQAGFSLRAQDIASEAKAEVLTSRDAPPSLRLRLPFPRAWATIGTALTNAAIEVDSADRETRRFLVHFDPALFAGEETGFFGRLLGRGPGEPDVYLLSLTEAENGYDLHVLDPETGAPADRELGEQLLSVLREYAS